MYHTYKKTYVSLFIVTLMSTLLFSGIGCDSVLPDEFQEKTFTAAEIDIRAGNLLAQDTLNDSQGLTYSYQIGPLDSSGTPIHPGGGSAVTYNNLPVTWSVISSQTLAGYATGTDTADNQIIHSKFNSLAGSLPSLHQDSLIIVNYPAGQNISYAVLNISSGQAKDVYIYTSLLYYHNSSNNGTNINDYVSVDLVKSDTSIVSSSSAMPSESAFCSYEKILYSSAPRVVSVIRARYKVHLDQGGVYVVRFTLSSPTISNPLSGIANQFKIAILSF
jgi:hypothetical protein